LLYFLPIIFPVFLFIYLVIFFCVIIVFTLALILGLRSRFREFSFLLRLGFLLRRAWLGFVF
jgi:hypothetical protein